MKSNTSGDTTQESNLIFKYCIELEDPTLVLILKAIRMINI